MKKLKPHAETAGSWLELGAIQKDYFLSLKLFSQNTGFNYSEGSEEFRFLIHQGAIHHSVVEDFHEKIANLNSMNRFRINMYQYQLLLGMMMKKF